MVKYLTTSYYPNTARSKGPSPGSPPPGGTEWSRGTGTFPLPFGIYLHTARSAERKPPACGSLFGVSQGPSQPTAAPNELLAASLVVREFQREWVVKVNLQGICEKYSIVRSKNHHDLDNKKPCANSFSAPTHHGTRLNLSPLFSLFLHNPRLSKQFFNNSEKEREVKQRKTFPPYRHTSRGSL